VRRLVFLCKVIDQALGVFRLEGNCSGEVSLEMRIVRVEAFGNEFGVVLVLGEDDRFL